MWAVVCPACGNADIGPLKQAVQTHFGERKVTLSELASSNEERHPKGSAPQTGMLLEEMVQKVENLYGCLRRFGDPNRKGFGRPIGCLAAFNGDRQHCLPPCFVWKIGFLVAPLYGLPQGSFEEPLRACSQGFGVDRKLGDGG